jgi:signal peptidase II
LHREERELKNKYLWVGLIITIVIILDQITKYFVVKHVRMYEIIPVIPDFFNLTYVRNRGAAFSLLSTAPDMFRIVFFITITIVALVVIALLIRKTHERLLLVALSLIAGGAIGNNLIDRVRYGAVIDFIQWYYQSYYWPSFNVADSAITIAVVLLAVDMLFSKTNSKSQAPNSK